MALALFPALAEAAPARGGPLGVPLPLFPADNWWNLDVSQAPVDANSAAYIRFIGASRGLHPDFGGYDSEADHTTYGFPYAVVDGSQTKLAVELGYADESDGVDHDTGESLPFYPIPEEAKTQPYWIEGGPAGNLDPGGDRHMLIIDKDNNHLYELWTLRWTGTHWYAGSGAFFDMNTNDRRPEGWTSADAAGLAILPGLVRYDDVEGAEPIRHAFRVTLRATNGYVYPASHAAGSTTGALPMGARLRLKASVDIPAISSDPVVQKILQAMKTYGLIVADNGSDLYVSGTFDPRWNNDVLNPAFASVTADDFEVIQLGWKPAALLSVSDAAVVEGNAGTRTLVFRVNLAQPAVGQVTVDFATGGVAGAPAVKKPGSPPPPAEQPPVPGGRTR